MTDAPWAVFYPEGHSAHFESGHPERPERVEALRQALETAGWWSGAQLLSPASLPMDLLHQVHDPLYIETLQEFCASGRHLDGDTYTTPASWQLALNAAGGAIAVAQAVWQGQTRRGFAMCRPPGHHATFRRGMGFCLLNNIAIAAQYLRSLPHGPRRLAIVDLDLHHGNGTQGIFWRRDDVVFFSLHQSPLYPGSGRMDERGEGPGVGYTINLPLPPGSGDQAFGACMQEVVLPLLNRLAPEMLLVSFGFDPHWRDPLGSLELSADGLYHALVDLSGWADARCHGKLAVVLEGGYDLDAARACGQALGAGLLGLPFDDSLGPSPTPESQDWLNILYKLKHIWNV